MNEIVTGRGIRKYDVKEFTSLNYGMCYIIIPKEIFMTPYLDYLKILVAKNDTSKKDKMEKVMVQISLNNTFHTIIDSAPAIDNVMISHEFHPQNKDNFLVIDYAEENTEYINYCSKIAFFKCLATSFASEEFKCSKKCFPFIHQVLMDTIDHKIPRCRTDVEHYCMMGTESLKTILKLKATCQKQCNNKGSKLLIKKSEEAYPYHLGSMQIAVRFKILPEIIYYKEYLIYDDIGMFGSIGGSLGLFLGFSLFDTLCMVVDFILRKLSHQVSQP